MKKSIPKRKYNRLKGNLLPVTMLLAQISKTLEGKPPMRTNLLLQRAMIQESIRASARNDCGYWTPVAGTTLCKVIRFPRRRAI